MYAIRNYSEVPELSNLSVYTVGRDLQCVFVDLMPNGYRIREALGMLEGCEVVEIERILDAQDEILDTPPAAKKKVVKEKVIEKAPSEYMDNNALSITSYKNMFKAIYKEVEKLFERDVMFCTDPYQYPNPLGDNKLRIYCFAPQDAIGRNDGSIETRVDEKWCVVVRSVQTQSRAVWCDTEDYLVAQGDDDNIYVSIYDGLKDVLLPILKKYHKTKATEYASENTEAQKVFNEYLNKKKIDLKKSFDETTNEIDANKERIIEEIRKQKRLEVALVALGESVALTIKNIEDKLAEVNAIKEIQKAYFKDKYLILQTTPLLSEIKKSTTTDKYIFGRISVLINLNSGEIRVRNKDFRVMGKAHPHAFGDGRVCLGSIEGTIAPLIASYELRAVADLILAFLKTYNPNDHEGQKAIMWPRLKEDGTIFIDEDNKNKTTIFNKAFIDGGRYADYEASCLHNL